MRIMLRCEHIGVSAPNVVFLFFFAIALKVRGAVPHSKKWGYASYPSFFSKTTHELILPENGDNTIYRLFVPRNKLLGGQKFASDAGAQ